MVAEEQIKRDMGVEQFFADKFDPQFREWQEGIAAGCKSQGYDITVEDLLLIAMFTSEFYVRPGGAYPDGFGENGEKLPEGKSEIAERHFCNSLAATGKATPDGKPIVVGNGGSAYEAIDRVIIVAFPEKGPSYTFCGTIGKFQDQMGLNSEGFAWVFTGNYSRPDVDWGMMPEVNMHYLSQCCKTPEEAQDWLKSIPRCGACGNFVMSDKDGNISVVESNSDHFIVRKPGDLDEPYEFMVNTNYFAAKELIDKNVELDGLDWKEWNHQAIKRYATLWEYVSEAAGKGQVDVDFVRKIFASDDWYDPDTKTWHYNDQGADQGWSNGLDGFDYTELTVLKPDALTAYFMQGTGTGTGMPAGSTGQFVEIKLGDDPMSMTRAMQERTFNIYVEARNKLRTVINRDKGLQRDYASRTAFENLLDEAYLEYERGMDRISFAYMNQYRKMGTSDDYLMLVGEAMSYFAKTQVYSRKLMTELDYYD